MNTTQEPPLQSQVASDNTAKIFKYKAGNVYENALSPNCFNTFTPNGDVIQAGPNWYSCRESFSPQFTPKTAGIMFSVKDYAEADQVAAFIKEIETRLNVAENTVFLKTEKVQAVAVMLSPFWRTNLAKRQLFTILLRCGRIYTGDNFDKAVNSQAYLQQTQVAFNHFMAGNHFVKPGGNERIKKAGGWYSYFRNIPADSERLRWLVNE